MQETGTIRLFKRGPTAELRLFVFVLLALSLLVVDSRWTVLDPARQAISVVLYPFQRLMLAPRDAVEHIGNWTDAAALAQFEMTIDKNAPRGLPEAMDLLAQRAHTDRRISNDAARWLALDHDPTGAFGPVPGFTLDREHVHRQGIARDRLVEQSAYLARGDTDGFQAKFGNLGTGTLQ